MSSTCLSFLAPLTPIVCWMRSRGVLLSFVFLAISILFYTSNLQEVLLGLAVDGGGGTHDLWISFATFLL